MTFQDLIDATPSHEPPTIQDLLDAHDKLSRSAKLFTAPADMIQDYLEANGLTPEDIGCKPPQ